MEVQPIFVLENNISGEDVARAMISGKEQFDPFYIFELDEAYKRLTYFKERFPRIHPFYAMKANPLDMMLRLAISAGYGFDCASTGEIRTVLQLGIDPKSIIYAMPAKNKYEMIYARKSGVQHTTFDSSYELQKLKRYWPDANLLIRIKVDGDSIYQLGDKFGCDFETEAVKLLDEAAAYGLSVIGVAFHVGSGSVSDESFAVALKRVRALFDFEARAGRRMHIVDIGGGFIGDTIDRIDQASAIINQSLSELFPEVQVIAEPGRYIAESALKLYCSIANVRTKIENNKEISMIYLNDGIYGTLRFPEFWHKVQKFQISKSSIKMEILRETILWGPSCDSTDRVYANKEVRLPTCSPQDWLMFHHQGAYSLPFITQFSFLDAPKLRTVISSHLWCELKDDPIITECDIVTNPSISSPLPQRRSSPPKFDRNRLLKTATLQTDK